ncbi:hypothetical protein HJG54_05670 [Leptolyngbya sp. NK1-12]|uniref:Uncharacterized protein n=1 Tax=Leptolyngbya sp. NK1-12 TaxID=2547451 RepID=A0AA97AH47_9CYAN|nr:hypothetical protein [Leptolyngbya sp. NK1-12]WNZ22396.1 hypothetical protein HJG54_05670 [Leptolyngbya sp. NK1-12]
MRNFEQNANSLDKLLMFISSVVGGAVSLMLIKNAPPEQAAIVCSLVMAGLSIACTQLTKPSLWWTAVGAIAGIIIGTGIALSEFVAQGQAPFELRVRCIIVGVQGLAGFIAGMLLGRKIHNPHVPPLKTFLSRLGALTTGLFGATVTIEYILAGLEVARSLSSRLSTTSTVLITTFVVPGAIGYLLTEHRTNIKRSETSESE